jgi:NAD-reducing hydrogenase small subunit
VSDKLKLATVWLDGCSGCHMSFLDIDERILDVAALADLVYSPLVDNKVFPEMVDITLIEGAVSSEEDYHKIQHVRVRTSRKDRQERKARQEESFFALLASLAIFA